MGSPAEIIKGEGLTKMLREWIRSKRVCKMEIPDTEYGWFTLLLGMGGEKDSPLLAIDHIAGFEKALAGAKTREVLIEFLERDGVRCSFTARILGCLPDQIHATLPEAIQRLQRRASFRMEALSGTEISFHVDPKREERGKVKDYSLGGLSFLVERDLPFGVGDRITGIDLQLPGSRGTRILRIPQTVIRRIETDPQGRRVCALEFLELAKKTRDELWTHLIETQRKVIAKMNKV
jgi:c-di-GMP-binding flagellar brake protein YcgR